MGVQLGGRDERPPLYERPLVWFVSRLEDGGSFIDLTCIGVALVGMLYVLVHVIAWMAS